MNAPMNPLTRAEQQALDAPFLIEDQEVVRKIARLADERGTPMQDIIRAAIDDHVQRHQLRGRVSEKLQKFWDEHPMPLPNGLATDKRFYDWLNDEL
ncbi:type II toxin-antitoxin system VapB family antitoxin [Sphingomonas bacterium]|uniref:type II toxin-antitoxin system VapB family antitoxin n=1 Tax=Sphingomonas bacterium TaxID=1895847 RepID=UPI001575E009|nr:type II toxin-antitoxin system VapB family antitoxin [Sphingomonas bacterium]